MKHRILFYFILPVILGCYTSKALSQVRLDSCHSKARDNYPLIQQFDLIAQSEEYTLNNANKAYLPQLSVNLVGGVIDGFPSFGSPNAEPSSNEFQLISVLQLNQTIWDGGMTKSRKEMVSASSAIEKANVAVSLYDLEARVNNLFFGILLIDEQLVQLELLQSSLKRNLKRVEVSVENGAAFQSDIDELSVEIINTSQRIDELKYNRSAYVTVLSAMIGESIDLEEEFARPELKLKVLNETINRPELSMFENQQLLMEAQERMNKTTLYPKVGLLGFGTFINPGVDFGPSKLTNILVAGLSVSWDIGGLYQNGNNKKLSELSFAKVENQKETFLFNTNLQLKHTESEIDKYQSLIDQDMELLQLKGRIKESYQTKYDNGIATMSQLLDRINDENVAKQNMIMHEIQYLMQVYQYKNTSGN